MNTPVNPPANPAANEPQPAQEKLAMVSEVEPEVTVKADNAAEKISDKSKKPGNVYTKGLIVCGNCGTELLGETCYQCGQPTKGLVRHFSSIMGDFLDTVLNIDSRVFRTIGPLIFKPGYLTQEYFSGRRIRFVSPVRLFFFLAVLTFLLAQISLPENITAEDGNSADEMVQINDGTHGRMSNAKTVAEVEKIRAEALAGLNEAEKEIEGVPMIGMAMQQSKELVNRQADKRIAELKKLNPAAEKNTSAPVVAESNNKDSAEEEASGTISFNGKPLQWHAEKKPMNVDWLPTSVNQWFNSLAERASNNGKKISKDPAVIIKAVLSALPMTLFLMLPIFALLLKIMFVFKRRLYMEHLIVALHSHAFLMLSILFLIALNDAASWVGEASWLNFPIGISIALLWIWMPIYLFLMQKRVYQQGWIMTFIKYFVIGNLHIILLTMAITATLIIKLIWL
jgi:Protein of unknown function (DUF3667)